MAHESLESNHLLASLQAKKKNSTRKLHDSTFTVMDVLPSSLIGRPLIGPFVELAQKKYLMPALLLQFPDKYP